MDRVDGDPEVEVTETFIGKVQALPDKSSARSANAVHICDIIEIPRGVAIAAGNRLTDEAGKLVGEVVWNRAKPRSSWYVVPDMRI